MSRPDTPASVSRAEAAGGPLAIGLRVVDLTIVAASIVAAVLSTTGLFIAIALEVVVRYLTNSSLAWVSEVPNLLFPWLTMSGIVLAAQWSRHILVELGVRVLPEAAGRALAALAQIPIAAVFLYLAWTGIEIIRITAGETFPVTRVQTSWAYLAMPVGFGLLAVTAATAFIRILSTRCDPLVPREGMSETGPEIQS